MNFITFDHYQWVAGSRDVACKERERERGLAKEEVGG